MELFDKIKQAEEQGNAAEKAAKEKAQFDWNAAEQEALLNSKNAIESFAKEISMQKKLAAAESHEQVKQLTQEREKNAYLQAQKAKENLPKAIAFVMERV